MGAINPQEHKRSPRASVRPFRSLTSGVGTMDPDVAIEPIDPSLFDCAEPGIPEHSFNDFARAFDRSHPGSLMHDRPLLFSASIVLSLRDRLNTDAVKALGF